MIQFCRAAKTILRDRFQARADGQSELARLLARYCPDEAAFERVEDVILLNLAEGPWPLHVSDGGVLGLGLPSPVVSELVGATRRAVYGLLRGVCEDILSTSLSFKHRTLYVKGRKVATWKDQEAGSRFQIAILDKFEVEKWPPSIENPLPANQLSGDTGQTLRKLKEKLRGCLIFRKRGNRVVREWAETRRQAGETTETSTVDGFLRLAGMVLRWAYDARGSGESELARLLAQDCPNEAAFRSVEGKVLENLPRLDSWPTLRSYTGRRVLLLPATRELVEATRAAAFQFMGEVMEEIAAKSLRFEDNTLFVKGQAAATFRNEKEGRSFQAVILASFQNANWAVSIPVPESLADMTPRQIKQSLKNLNNKVKKWLYVDERDGYLIRHWSGALTPHFEH
jgi:hypothetical protein